MGLSLRFSALALSFTSFACLVTLAGCDCAGTPASTSCTSRTDCRAGESCIDGRCQAGPDGGSVPDAPMRDAFTPDAPFVSPDTGTDAGPTCAGVACDVGERCEIVAGAPSCVPNECSDLTCTATERCEPAPVGMGHVCVDVSCTDSLDCPAGEYCNGTICVTDVCTAGDRTCDGMGVSICADDGGGTTVRYTCGSSTRFTSDCTTDTRGAFCPCEDDWDCPANTRCEVGRCEGTGVAPTCRVAPQPFASVLPTREIKWGGTSQAMHDAVGAPFPTSSQVSATPVVVNLDDDNGDGRIDELDTPEIVFQTYCGTDVSTNGALRAIHGGGPNRGHDYFAVLGPTTTWHEGSALPTTTTCANGDLNSTSSIAAGDLDGDGVPEIVAITENDGIAIVSNDGTRIATSAASQFPASYVDPSPAIANLDHAGLPEIVVGNVVFTLRHDTGMPLTIGDVFRGTLMVGLNGQGPISCLGDVAGDENLELVAGSTVYRLPTPPAGVTRIADCAVGNTTNFCLGRLDVVWDGQTVNGTTQVPAARRDGFCAVADVLGVDGAMPPGPMNPLDGTPEVVLIADGYLMIYAGASGTLLRNINLGAGTDGGAPNVDDFDGDGFPEVGTAFGTRYIAYDLQPATAMCPAWPNAYNDAMMGLQGNPARTAPASACTTDTDCGDATQFACNETIGRCVCLHNGWMRVTEDDSSRVTGSTLFDFNGDGGAEVVYNDECYFRVYDGLTGAVAFRSPSSSRTRVENAVVADVDNDGNAEIVFGNNNDTNSCSVGQTANGIEVWGDASDSWVSARRIWNQHAYHVTNVTESAGVPLYEPRSWGTYAGRSYDTYRSQPRSYGVAPDLTIDRVQASSPDAACGTLGTMLDIVVRVQNRGDLRVGADTVLTFYGEWAGASEPLYADLAMTPLTTTLGTTLEPGGTTLVTVRYVAANNGHGALPDMVRVVIDEANAERECHEDNNSLSIPIDGGSTAPDLAVHLGAVGGTCPAHTFVTTVENVGSAPTSDVVVRFYIGDPSAGGVAFHDEVFTGTLAPGGMSMRTVTIDPYPIGPDAIVYVVVDPDDAIAECNDGNNRDQTTMRVGCSGLI